MRSEDIIIIILTKSDEISTVSLFHSTIHCSVSFLVSQFYYDYSIEDETQQQQKIDDPNCMPHIIIIIVGFLLGWYSRLPPSLPTENNLAISHCLSFHRATGITSQIAKVIEMGCGGSTELGPQPQANANLNTNRGGRRNRNGNLTITTATATALELRSTGLQRRPCAEAR